VISSIKDRQKQEEKLRKEALSLKKKRDYMDKVNKAVETK